MIVDNVITRDSFVVAFFDYLVLYICIFVTIRRLCCVCEIMELNVPRIFLLSLSTKKAPLTLCRPVWVLLVFMQRNQIKIMSKKIKVSSCSLRLHSLFYTEIPACFSFCSSFSFNCQFSKLCHVVSAIWVHKEPEDDSFLCSLRPNVRICRSSKLLVSSKLQRFVSAAAPSVVFCCYKINMLCFQRPSYACLSCNELSELLLPSH